MSSILDNLLDPFLDIHGADTVDQAKVLADENLGLGDSTQTGTGDSVTAPDGDDLQTLTDAGATFTAADVGRFIVIAGMTNADNNGTFLVAEYVDGTNIKIYNTNASAGAETSAFTWDVREPYYIGDDLNFTRTDRKLIKGTTNYYDAVPTYERPSAIGTDVPANLTNLAGVTLDAKTTVRNVKQTAVKLRPGIADGDGAILVTDETFTTTGFHFIADDLNSFITLTDGTAVGATGTYRIKAVTDGQTLELEGLAATGAGTATWVLESDLKGILSSRPYADAVDRRGIPIADSGAYDETIYEATFADYIDPVTGGRPVEEDGDDIWARSFGDAKDSGTGNEGTRFFVQLLTGTNDGTATDASLEFISGRSGSAASITGGNTNITGLTGMTDQDIGRWISIWNLAADEAGHYQIATIVSATEITVTRGSSFTADASGAVEWRVSRHPDTWDFYNGDRYRSDELSETAGRTTLIGGVIADAELAQDIAEIREFIGAADGDTTPTLTNTGTNYIWSDLPDPSDTSVEECLNTINLQAGDRNWTGTILTPGDNITDAIQDLADAISSASLVRTIERLAATIPKNTAHTVPVTYTLDATDNGLNMFMFVRGVLWDPGPISGGNRYDETSTTSITPYEKINVGDHINYMVLQ